MCFTHLILMTRWEGHEALLTLSPLKFIGMSRLSATSLFAENYLYLQCHTFLLYNYSMCAMIEVPSFIYQCAAGSLNVYSITYLFWRAWLLLSAAAIYVHAGNYLKRMIILQLCCAEPFQPTCRWESDGKHDMVLQILVFSNTATVVCDYIYFIINDFYFIIELGLMLKYILPMTYEAVYAPLMPMIW